MATCCKVRPCNCGCNPLPPVASFILYRDVQSGTNGPPFTDPPLFTAGWIFRLTLAPNTGPGPTGGVVTLPNGDKLPFFFPDTASMSNTYQGEAATNLPDFDRTQPFEVTVEDVCGNIQTLTIPGLQPIVLCKGEYPLIPAPFAMQVGPPGPVVNIMVSQGECVTIPAGTYEGAAFGLDVVITETVPAGVLNNSAATLIEPLSALVSVGDGTVTVKIPEGGVKVTFYNYLEP
jgi:hypothetical protein